MTDAEPSDRLAAKRAQNRQERLAGITRWVEYIQAQPPEVWGPQQNRLVNSQLQSARETGSTPEHERAIRAFGELATDDES